MTPLRKRAADSPLERLIDAHVRCLCCKQTMAGCTCATGVRCDICRRCASHCKATDACDDWWLELADHGLPKEK